jgi:hypothetical protein
VSAGRLRVVMIAFFVAALVLTAIPAEQRGPVFAAGVACFFGGMLLFLRWRRALRAEAQTGNVFDREEKTVEGGTE